MFSGAADCAWLCTNASRSSLFAIIIFMVFDYKGNMFFVLLQREEMYNWGQTSLVLFC